MLKAYKVHLPFLILILAYFSFSFLTYKDFGITSDESTEYSAGKKLYEYFLGIREKGAGNEFKDDPTTSYYYRAYPMVVSLFNIKGYYEWYHLENLLFASIIFVTFYVSAYVCFKKAHIAIIGTALLLLTPRFFGDLPANTKDMPFAVFYFVSLTAIYFVLQKQFNPLIKVPLLGMLFGITQSLRILGFSVYLIYFLAILHAFWLKRIDKKRVQSEFIQLGLIFLIANGLTYLTWPVLQGNYIKNLFNVMLATKAFVYWDRTIFFAGEFLKREQRPWYYLLTWIFITTPLSTLFLFAYSIIKSNKFIKNSLFFILFLAFFLNISLYLILQPITFNGLRHFLYLLPILVMLSLFAFEKLFIPKFRVLIALLFLNLGLVFVSMVRLHPYEYVYFNETVSGLQGAYGKYELDYWATSYKEATQWLVANNSNRELQVYPCNVSYAVLYYSKGNFKIVNSQKDAQVIICDTDNDRYRGLNGKIIHEITRFDVPLNIIRDMRL